MNLLIIGGDKRQEILTENLRKAGHNCFHITGGHDLDTDFDNFEVVILPYPTTKDGLCVNNNLSDEKILLADIVKRVSRQKVLCGNYSFINIESTDYGRDEELTLLNAVPTAEGAIELAIRNTDFTLWQSNCLVIGNGKCGKILADRLAGLKAHVTVSARKDADFAYIKALGQKYIHTYEIEKHIHGFDIIFNTVDSRVITREALEKCKKDCLLIELASAPFGIDFNAAEELGLKVIKAPGLPGKISPKTAADILTQTILKLI